MIPTLTTARLTLRAQTMADFPSFRDMAMSDRSIHMDGPYSADQAWDAFASDVAQWTLFGFGGLSVELTDTGVLIGNIGLCQPPHFPEPELGWVLYAGREGQGYATEAAAALRDWGLGPRGLDTIVSYVGRDNPASIAVATRLGAMIDPAAATPRGEDCLVFRHRRIA